MTQNGRKWAKMAPIPQIIRPQTSLHRHPWSARIHPSPYITPESETHIDSSSQLAHRHRRPPPHRPPDPHRSLRRRRRPHANPNPGRHPSTRSGHRGRHSRPHSNPSPSPCHPRAHTRTRPCNASTYPNPRACPRTHGTACSPVGSGWTRPHGRPPRPHHHSQDPRL